MKSKTAQEALQRVGAPLHEFRAEPVPGDVHHAVLVGKRRNRTLRVFCVKGIIQEDKVRESPPDRCLRFLEGWEIGLILSA